jgi:aquaporin Z
MNPARSIAPALVSGTLQDLWIYIAAPILGAAVGALAYQAVRGEPTRRRDSNVRDMDVLGPSTPEVG